MANMRVFLLIAILVSGFIVPAPFRVQAAALPEGFQESTVFSGLTNPTNVEFSPDGRIFVAEKSGLIKIFDNLADTTPTVFADLRTNTHNFWDRGMLGMALAPNFPTDPYVYVLYTHDGAIGGTAPRWGTAGETSDGCPNPPGPTTDGCVVSGRLSRLEADGNVMAGSEQVLIEDWCQQFPGHSIGDLAFGGDGALYVSAGDGANFNNIDYGQYGNVNSGFERNPCGDPPGGVGGSMTPPTAEGGALRAQSLRRTAGSAVNLNGSILRVDPDTGLGMPDNPLAANSNVNAQRIIAYGLRNPFRIVARPGTNEIWIGEVGWNTWEEIDRIPDPSDSVVENFGWPCYEGIDHQAGYDGANLNSCENLYAEGINAITMAYFKYNPYEKVVSSDTCPTGSVSIAGLAFQSDGGHSYPATYDNALFFADYSRGCIWVMFEGSNGLPNPSNVLQFVDGAASPVDLEIGPDGNLYYVDFDGGSIRRIEYFSENQPPSAVATANPTSGPAPLDVIFDGSGSSDPDTGDTITFAWDLDGDGAYDDSTNSQPSLSYPAGTYTVRLQITDNHGATTISHPITITSGNTAPSPTMDSPTNGTTWQVGDVINFSGSATDLEDGPLSASAFAWTLIMHHCPSNCHSHPIQTFSGVSNGSFSAPDHEYPSHLELQLTVTDSGGLSTTVSRQLDPQTVTLSFQSSPGGLQVTVNASTQTTPFDTTVIAGSSNSVTAVSPQTNGSTYYFQSWSDGGAQTHTVVAPESAATYTAAFTTTLAPAPAAFGKTSPVHKALKRSPNPTLKWAASKRATSYEYCIDTIKNNACETSWIPVAATSVGLNGLLHDTVYYWQVRAVNATGTVEANAGAWWNFRVKYAPPALVSPNADEEVPALRPMFDWDNVANATDYLIQISKNASFTQVFLTGNPKGSAYTPAVNLPKDTILYWRVRANGPNGPSSFSSARAFMTPVNPPAAPALLLPFSNALVRDYTPIFTWKSVTGAQNYILQVDNNANFSSPEVNDSSSTVPTFTLTTDLPSNTRYYWRVRAVNSDGELSNWSASRYFRTAIRPPGLFTPTDDATAVVRKPLLDWENVPGNTGYVLQIWKSGTTPVLVKTVTLAKNISQYQFNTNLLPNTGYFWKVRTLAVNGPSSWSIPFDFATGP